MIIPLHKNVIVKKIEEKKSEVILTVEIHKEAPTKGEVVHAGENKEVSVGDVVLFSMFAPIPVKDDDTLLIISVEDIYAKIQ